MDDAVPFRVHGTTVIIIIYVIVVIVILWSACILSATSLSPMKSSNRSDQKLSNFGSDGSESKYNGFDIDNVADAKSTDIYSEVFDDALCWPYY